MPDKDLFESLCKFYEFMLGPLPARLEFKRTLQDTVTADELSAFFLLPFSGTITQEKLQKKAHKAGLPPDVLHARLNRLASEGFILAYDTPAGLVFERGNPVFMTEQQVRKPEDTPRRTFYAHLFNTFLEGGGHALPTKTPYYRVLPVEATLTGTTKSGTLVVNEVIPDPRGVLPIDVVSAMVRDVKLIGVAECYCRKTKRILGAGCEYPLETCLVFDELAQTLIEHGTARQIGHDDMMDILWQSEKLGLVHNVDNCLEEIRSLCNCCSCCCAVLKTWARGSTNAGAPSRYVVAYDADRCTRCETCISRCPTHARAKQDGRMVVDTGACLGCGLCVAACPRAANRMILRGKHPAIPRTNPALYSKIGREAIVGMVKSKILGR